MVIKLAQVLAVLFSFSNLNAMQDMGRFFMMVNSPSDSTNKKLVGGAVAGTVSGGSVAAVGAYTGNPLLFFCGMGTMFASQMGTSSKMLCNGKTTSQPTTEPETKSTIPPQTSMTTAWLNRYQKTSVQPISLPGSVAPETITQ